MGGRVGHAFGERLFAARPAAVRCAPVIFVTVEHASPGNPVRVSRSCPAARPPKPRRPLQLQQTDDYNRPTPSTSHAPACDTCAYDGGRNSNFPPARRLPSRRTPDTIAVVLPSRPPPLLDGPVFTAFVRSRPGYPDSRRANFTAAAAAAALETPPSSSQPTAS